MQTAVRATHARAWPARQEAPSAMAAYDQHSSQSTVAPNLLARCEPTGPNQARVTDVTYVETAQGWLYIAAILDGWSHRVVGWSRSATFHTPLVLAALESAIARCQPEPKVTHHADRGCQYVDTTYRAMPQITALLRA